MNDYILHLISVAPKSNGDLQKLLEIVLKEYNSLEHAQEVDSLLPCVKEAVQQVVRCYRGLVALISPQFGILGSTPSDVDFISKVKKARTVKSGVSAGVPAPGGHEVEIQQLISASEWWMKAVDAYSRTAPRSQLLRPKLEAAMQEAEGSDTVPLTCEP